MHLKTEQLTHENTPRQATTLPFVLLCDGLSSPANTGSLFRLADALGIKHLYFLNGTPDLNSNRLKRTSRTCEKRVAYSMVENPLALITQLKNEKYSIIGLELTTDSVALNDFNSELQKIALLIGSERNGISSELLAFADHLLHIPMRGQNSSMNVSHAAAIAAYQLINNLNHG